MVRNGPGMFKIGDTEYKHWFDGMAYIQRYHFEDAKVSLRLLQIKPNIRKFQRRFPDVLLGSVFRRRRLQWVHAG